jgi:hypothetical protein
MLARWVALWRQAGLGSRVLFVLVLLFFAGRSVYSLKTGRADRLGFLDMGTAALAGDFDRELTRNTYPPAFSVAMAPIAALRRLTGDAVIRHLWGTAQLLALLYLTLAFDEVLELGLGLGAIAVAWLAVWRPIAADLNNQNVSLFLLAMVAAALGDLRKRRPLGAGLWLGAGASLKLWPGFAVVGSLRSPRVGLALLCGIALAMLGSALAVLATLGPGRAAEAMRFWLGDVAMRAGGSELANQSWRGEALRLNGIFDRSAATGPYQWQMSHAGNLGLAVGATLWLQLAIIASLRPARSARVGALDAALSLVLGTTALPVAWPHAYVVLLPLSLALVSALPELKDHRLGILALFVAGVVLTSVLDYDLIGRPLAGRLAFYGSGLLGALCFFAAGVKLRRLWQSVARSPGDAEGAIVERHEAG